MNYGVMANFGPGFELTGKRDLTKRQADTVAARIRLETGCPAHSVLLEKGKRVKTSGGSITLVVPRRSRAKKGDRGKVE